MRLSSKDLHQLVHSFSAKEKMLFKRFNKHAGKNAAFIVLFDVLAGMEHYSENQLKHILAKKGTTGYLKSLKTYLYEQIMEFLRANPGVNNKRWHLRRLNIDGDILLERGLHRNAFELYNEQYKLAESAVNPHHQLTAIDNLISYSARKVDMPALQKYDELLVDRLSKFHSMMVAQIEFRKINAFHASHFPVRDAKVFVELDKLAQSPVMLKQDNMLTPQANYYYFNFHIFNVLLRNDFESAYSYSLKRYKYEQQQNTRDEGTFFYRLTTLELLIKTAVRTNRVNEALDYYKALLALSGDSKDLRVLLVKHACFAYLNAFIDWDGANENEREATMRFFELHKASFATIKNGMMSLAYAFFRHKEYRHVITLVNHVMEEKFSFQQSVLQTEARLLAIVTHYEMKNYRLISYMVNNTRRYLKQESKLYPFENALLNGIKQLPDKINAGDMRKTLVRINANLKEILENPLEQGATTGFDFVSWIDQKLKAHDKAS